VNEPTFTAVVARARNGAIGRNGALPWRLPSDLQNFKAATWGKPMIMGRKTFQSIGRALPGRRTLVLTRDAHFAAADVLTAHDIDGALALARAQAREMGAQDVAIVGGAEIYAALAPWTDRMIVTEVDLVPEGDAFFAAPDPAIWREVKLEQPTRGPRDDADFVIRHYEKFTG
jgi:dihydrofolate reductase